MTRTDDPPEKPEAEPGAPEGGAGEPPEAEAIELSVAEQVFCDFVRLTDSRDAGAFEELCATRPELEPELRRIHFNWQRVAGLLEHLQGGPTFGEQLRQRLGADYDPGISLDDREGSSSSVSASRTQSSQELLTKLSAGRPAVRRYEVRDEVARGGMGAIFRIWDRDLRRTLAMKVMLQGSTLDVGVDERVLGRFLEEAQITGQLDHPGIVPVHDLGLDARGRVYFTMRYVRGIDLKQVLEHAKEEREGWTQVRVLGVLQRISEAVAFAHSKGVVHRDLKPANVMVGRFGETYVMDWGLAKVVGREERSRPRSQRDISLSIVRTDRGDERDQSPDSPLVTLDGDVIGTPSYMSPEQALGKLDELGPRSDIYSVGCILYQLLTGHVPYVPSDSRISPHTVLSRLLEGPPTPIAKLAPGVPSELAAICEKAMRREPERRYGDMMEFAEDIRAFLEGRVVQAYETGAVAEFRKWVARNKALAGATAAAVLIAIAALSWVLVVQTRANADLELAMGELQEVNLDLEVLTAQAEEAAERERQSAEESRLQATLAARSEELARRRAYVTKLLAVDYSLRLNEFSEAKRLLEECEERYRGWEWDNLSLRTDTSLLTLDFYPRRLKHARFTGDGSRILAGMAESFFDYWDSEEGTSLVRLTPRRPPFDGPGGANNSLSALSGDSTRAVAWGEYRGNQTFGAPIRSDIVPGRILQVWDLVSGDEPAIVQLAGIPLEDVDPGLEGGVPKLGDYEADALALGPSGELVAVALNEVERIYVLDLAELRVVQRLAGVRVRPQLGFTAFGVVREQRPLAFSHDGTELAVSLEDDSIHLYSIADGAERVAMDGHDDVINQLAFHPTQALLASVSDDRTARLWETSTGRLRTTLVGHTGPVVSVAFGAAGDDTRVITGSEDTTARVWDYERALELATLRGHEGAVDVVAYDPDGTRVLTAARDRTVKIWDPELTRAATEMRTLQTSRTFVEEATTAAVFSPDGAQVLSGTSAGNVWRWDSYSGSPLARLEGPERWISSVAFDPSGELVAAASGDEAGYVWDAHSDVLLGELHGHGGKLTDLVFHPATGNLVTASSDETLRVWEPRTGALLGTYEGHRHDVRRVVAQPKGFLVASLAGRREIHVWDPTTLELVREIEIDRGRVNALAFQPDGKALAVGSREGKIQVWSLETGALLLERESNIGSIERLAYAPSGSRLAAGGNEGEVEIWDAVWGEPLLGFAAHKLSLTGLAFDPEGRRLLTSAAGMSRAAWPAKDPPRVWETSSPRERRAVIRAAADLRERVSPVVDEWFEELYFADDVRRRIAMEPKLSQTERQAALRIVSLRGDDPGFLVATARELLRRPKAERDASTARRLAEAAVVLEPDDLEGSLWLGIALYETRGYESAAVHFRNVVDGLGGTPLRGAEPTLFLARTYARLCEALAGMPDGPDAGFLRDACRDILQADQAQLDQDAYALAEDLIRWSLELDPVAAESRVTLGIVLYRRGQYESALEVLEQAANELEAAGNLTVRDLATSFQILCHYRLGRIDRGDEIAVLLREGVESLVPAAVQDVGGFLGSSRLEAMQAILSSAPATLTDINEYLSSSISIPFLSSDGKKEPGAEPQQE